MTRLSPEQQYTLDRAVWLYERLSRAIDLHAARQARVLSYRLQRWLATCDRALAAAYYQRLSQLRVEAVYDDPRTEARAQLSREAGDDLLRTISREERLVPCGRLLGDDATTDEEPDDDVDTE